MSGKEILDGCQLSYQQPIANGPHRMLDPSEHLNQAMARDGLEASGAPGDKRWKASARALFVAGKRRTLEEMGCQHVWKADGLHMVFLGIW